MVCTATRSKFSRGTVSEKSKKYLRFTILMSLVSCRLTVLRAPVYRNMVALQRTFGGRVYIWLCPASIEHRLHWLNAKLPGAAVQSSKRAAKCGSRVVRSTSTTYRTEGRRKL